MPWRCLAFVVPIMAGAWMCGSAPAAESPPVVTKPFAGKPAAIPGTIEAEHFDLGDEGQAYHDLTDRNHGANYREATGADIEKRADASNGHGIGWTRQGEWLVYSVEVAKSGTYRLEVPIASKGRGGVFHVEFDGVDVTGPIQVPDTGGWDRLQVIDMKGIKLRAGPARMRVVMESDGAVPSVADIDCLRFSVDAEAAAD